MFGKSIWLLLLVAKFSYSNQELNLVHVFFVHPNEFAAPGHVPITQIYDVNSTSETEILETMTNKEKRDTYNLGVRLRERYNTFLPAIYSPAVTRTRTTDADVSIMSGALVNAGLWPPAKEQQWLKDFLWQPVSTEYVPRSEDTLLMGKLCPRFFETTELIRESSLIFELEKKHRKLFSLVSKNTGLDMSNSKNIADLYKNLEARVSRNLTLPSWTEGIFPDGEMLNVTYLEDSILSSSIIQSRLNGGFLIQKILADSAACAQDFLPKDRKMMIYSGDSVLFVGVLKSLGLWKPHVPKVSSALIFEFWKNLENEAYEIKVFHDLGETNTKTAIPMTIPGCKKTAYSTGCRFDYLVDLLINILPGDDESICGKSVTEIRYEEEEVSVDLNVLQSDASRTYYGVSVISCVLMLTKLF